MAITAQWTKYRSFYEAQVKPKQGPAEKLLADFDKLVVAGISANVKALDTALTSRNLNAINKLEAEYHKRILDFRVASQKLVTELSKKNPARGQVVQHCHKTLGSQLQDLKDDIGGLRKSAQQAGPQAATDVIPPSLFEQVRSTRVTRDPNVIKFTGGKEFGRSIADGTPPLAAAATLQKRFEKSYDGYLVALKQLDVIKAKTATRDVLASALAGAFNQVSARLNEMSMHLTEWQMEQGSATNETTVKASATYATAKAVADTVSVENDRFVKLRDAAAKLFPSQFR